MAPTVAFAETGYRLEDALEQLRLEGVDTLYASRSIDIEARILELPAAGPAAQRLRTLLAPLGLVARPTPEGQFVISPAPSGLLEGTVRADPGGQAVPFAEVRLASGEVITSDAEGRFRFLRVPAGTQRLDITLPGYVSRQMNVVIKAGTRHRLDAELKIDAETSEEIFVSTAPEEPPLGTVQLSTRQTRNSLLASQDALASGARLPGTRPDGGYSRGVSVRGHEAQRMALVVDGIEIDEPYHLRDLGNLAGVIAPTAVGQIKLHRSSPPVIYGSQSGGVLEVLTETPGRRFTAQVGGGDEALHAALGGSALSAQIRWLAAYRRGRPDLPRDSSGTNRRPSYLDGLAKLTTTLHARHELTFQTLWVKDDIDVDDVFPTFVESPTTLRLLQNSRYSHARYLGRLGQRHLVEFTLFDADIERDRFGQELFTEILTPEGTNNHFVLGDQRLTQRFGANVRGSTSLGERLEWRWGAETERESTTYDYLYVGRTREPPFRAQADIVLIEDELEQNRLGLYSEAQWQLRSDTTLSGGARYDADDLSGESALMPRLSLSVRAGGGVWRASWSRVTDFPSSHELPLADFEETLPRPETSDFASLGWERAWGGHRLAIETYSQAIEDPRLRFISLFRSVSRFPELEIDRLRIDAEESRNQGLEARYGFRGQRYELSAAYELSRFEDRQLDGSWRPRISDRRHSLQLWLVAELPNGFHADLLWRGVSGRPTTALDIKLAEVDFSTGLGEINGGRLSWEHRLDLRLSREMEIWGTKVRVMLGLDNLLDKRDTLGLRLFQLFPLDQTPSPEVLIAERSLGREHRWSVEFSW